MLLLSSSVDALGEGDVETDVGFSNVPFISDVTDCVNCDVISDLEEVVDNVDGVAVEEG